MSATLLTLLLAAAPLATHASRPYLVIAVQQQTLEPLDAATVAAIGSDIRDVWQRYADIAVGSGADVSVVHAGALLTLVITDSLSPAGDGLGWIDFVDGRPSTTIYVSRTLARRLGEEGRWMGRAMSECPGAVREFFLRRAIARAASHEIGHFLLQSKAHSASGLMRSHFTVADIMDTRSTLYRLDRAQQQMLQNRVPGYLLAREGTSPTATQ